MATTLSIGVSAWPVLASKPTTAYGQLATLNVRAGNLEVELRAATDKIPRNATITHAELRFGQATTIAGSYTLRAYANTGAWPASIRWSTRPAIEATFGSQTRSGPRAGSWWQIDVTNAIQRIVAGELVNRGFRLISTVSAAALPLRGATAAAQRPVLVVTYTVPPPVPTNLQPAGAAISEDKPALMFDGDASLIGLQAQVDPAADAAAPAFDSGTVVTSGGMLDLAETTYPGLDAGATTWWRARQQTDGGWSDWSSWVQMTHVAQPTLAITSPSGATDADGNVQVSDGSPPITWTFSGTEVAWRARILADNGDVLADSGRKAGSDLDWAPTAGLTADGQVGVIELAAWDDVDRAATAGTPVETLATLGIVLVYDPTIDPFTGVAAASDWFEPDVTITGHRDAIPDQVALTRNGAEIGRWAGADVMTPDPAGGYIATVVDSMAVMDRPAVYRLVPVVNGKSGSATGAVRFTPHCAGIWLTDVDDHTQRVLILGNDDQDQDQPEISIVHQPLSDDLVAPAVRRRLVRAAPQGSITGHIQDTADGRWSALDMETRLRSWVADDAGTRYWLTLGGYTGQVIIGDVILSEVSSAPQDGRVLGVSLNWWGQ